MSLHLALTLTTHAFLSVIVCRVVEYNASTFLEKLRLTDTRNMPIFDTSVISRAINVTI